MTTVNNRIDRIHFIAGPASDPLACQSSTDGIHYCSTWSQVQTVLRTEHQCVVELESINYWRTELDRGTVVPSMLNELQGIRNPERRCSRLAGRVAARCALKRVEPNAIEPYLAISNHSSEKNMGKPFFSHFPSQHLSISHSGTLAIAGVCKTDWGIDIEQIQIRPPSFERYFFSKKEQNWIQSNTAHRNIGLHILWTRKEAASKQMGRGGTLPFKSLSACNDASPFTLKSFIVNDYVVSVSFSPEGGIL